MIANLRKRFEKKGAMPSKVEEDLKSKNAAIPGRAAGLLMMGLVSLLAHPFSAFTAYDCTNRTNIV
jgi:hypothetical protein